MTLIDKKRILIIENTPDIEEAINNLNEENIKIERYPNLDEKWIEEFKLDKISEHPLIKKYNIQIDKNNVLLKSFYAIYKNIYDGIVIGHIYTSKIVFIYSIIFFGQNILSTSFICEKNKNISIWTDCALNINPNYEQFYKIILNACELYYNNVKNIKTINVHLLSFSTMENSNDESIKIYNKLINETNWEHLKYKINLIGPIQYDASINKDIYFKKTNFKRYFQPHIFVFPNLNAGNIAYKVESQYSKFYGPFICGVDKKIADLSRSATIEEIIKTIKYLCDIKKD